MLIYTQKAISRHCAPWNWSLHVSGLAILAVGLWNHSPALLFLSAAALAGGFFKIPLPPMKNCGLSGFEDWTAGIIKSEKNWLESPMSWKKGRQATIIAIAIVLSVWALWSREMAALALLAGFAVLATVLMENKKKGIDP